MHNKAEADVRHFGPAGCRHAACPGIQDRPGASTKGTHRQTQRIGVEAMQDSITTLSVVKYSVFDPETMHYFSGRKVNYATRVLCKVLAVEMFVRSKTLHTLVEGYDADVLADWLRDHWYRTVNVAFGWEAFLVVWAAANKPRDGRTTPTLPVNWLGWMREPGRKIDWGWIARFLKDELDRHGDRALNRTYELMCGHPIERLEAKINCGIDKLSKPQKRILQVEEC